MIILSASLPGKSFCYLAGRVLADDWHNDLT